MRKYSGFTLAEVLITLGIIGVVAAITIPALIANHRKNVVETRLAKFYSAINQAISRAEVDYGDKKLWEPIGYGYETDESGNPDETKLIVMKWFEKYLKPYLQYTDVKTFNDLVQIYFADGSMLIFRQHVWIFYPEAKNFKSKVNDDGTKELVETSGRKSFAFFFRPNDERATYKYHYNKGVEPYTYEWDGIVESLKTSSRYGCNKNASDSPVYCTKLIQVNGWKIPKDYPFKL